MRWLLLFLPLVAIASSGDDIEIDNDVVSGSDVSNAINTESMSISAGFGGVEIHDCIYTVQYFILFQGAKINPLCVADKLDAIGKHKEAAEMRCSIKRFRQPYGNANQCVRVTMYVPPMQQSEPAQAPSPVQSAPPEYAVQQQQIEDLNAKFDQYDRDKRRAAKKYAEDQAFKEEIRQEMEERFSEK